MVESIIQRAIEETRILYTPTRRIASFGDTVYNFRIITESLDELDVCHVRSGRIEALRPRIWRPEHLRGLQFDGFKEDITPMLDWMEKQGAPLPSLMQYGFQFRRSETTQESIHESSALLEDQLRHEALHSGDPLRAVIAGPEDAWEHALMVFMLTMIQESHEINLFDFHRRGLL